VLILAVLLLGVVAGGIAWLIVRGGKLRDVNWAEAVVAGLVGSVVGGLLINLIRGDGVELTLSGIIGSTVGAVIVLLVWGWVRGRRRAA
jgi:uncharacterized membrane protein YeaQ/YmgE (transglycosylase-associated protein family)